MFNFSKGSSHLNLPPTSMALLPNIKRSFWYTYDITHILDEQRTILNPEHYGFIMIDSLLLPERVLSKIDERFTEICKNCTNCSRSTCLCRTPFTICSRFCSCTMKGDCKNPCKLLFWTMISLLDFTWFYTCNILVTCLVIKKCLNSQLDCTFTSAQPLDLLQQTDVNILASTWNEHLQLIFSPSWLFFWLNIGWK